MGKVVFIFVFSHLWHHRYSVLFTLSWFTYFMISYMPPWEFVLGYEPHIWPQSKNKNDAYKKESSTIVIGLWEYFSAHSTFSAYLWTSNRLPVTEFLPRQDILVSPRSWKKNMEMTKRRVRPKAASVSHWHELTVTSRAREVHRQRQACRHVDVPENTERFLTLRNLGDLFCFYIWSAKVILLLLIISS